MAQMYLMSRVIPVRRLRPSVLNNHLNGFAAHHLVRLGLTGSSSLLVIYLQLQGKPRAASCTFEKLSQRQTFSTGRRGCNKPWIPIP
ncbi:hypothetical protein P692DRAFT_20439148 [Suillus brevipes Sb2]|nr:hypothetical protein P692DRAFT_20439148 [Suillus brevipes Sb2]